MQRLWCTDTGVAGRYFLRDLFSDDRNVQLEYAWLRDAGMHGRRNLTAVGQESAAVGDLVRE